MPAAKDHPAVREQVRLLYLGNGRNLTLAAKTVGVPVDRAEKWKERGKWDESKDSAAQQLAVSESVGKTADKIADMLDAGKNPRLLSLVEKREYLAGIVRTPIGEVDEKSPLAQKVKRTRRTDKDGNTYDTEEIELPGKLKAVELDAKLAGELEAPDKAAGMISFTLVRMELHEKPAEKVIELE